MENYDESVKKNHNRNWPYIPDYPYKILIIGGSGSGKTNALLNLTKHQQPGIDKILAIRRKSIRTKVPITY